MNESWKELLDSLPPDEVAPTSAISLGRRAQECADLALWTGIDKADPGAIRDAVRSGANIDRTRNGCTPVFSCLEKGRLDLCQVLVDLGAKMALGNLRNGNPWKAILVRDDPKEAQQLMRWGASCEWVDAKILAENDATNILLWWLEQGGVDGIPLEQSAPHTSEHRQLISFFTACVNGSYALHMRLNRMWGIEDDGVDFLARWGDKTVEALWSEIAMVDDPKAAKKAIQAGWLSSSPGIVG